MREEENEHPPGCDASEDDHVITLRIDFMMGLDDDGDEVVRAASIQSHVHGVPPMSAAETLLITAKQLVMQALAHTVFEGCPNEELKHALAEASSAVYMKSMIDNLPEKVQEVEFEIPDDLSEMLGEQ
jgi:hypothetical protein